ncbi:phage antirepressor KilAC domain-containing protein [Massilia sp. CCM 8734]|uniref:phage antirepressor KilAC domain-containing protein n=1 Tax=Massilia sp. CCM 8734 TaxID=2609283 RepID=UPI00141F2EBA|nr:phage antirepressor KilAC domain-containing protein [Massilia sp. CCM 8734]NHZ94594.1 hypothetical protein [Massilia sp. CCM 8734]
MLPQKFTGAVPAMSSIELVDVINSAREPGKPKIRHDRLMVKVAKVLGVTAPSFYGTVSRPQPAGGTREYPCYYLPKREAELVVMSESYEVQAKVYDRMTALEVGRATPPAPILIPTSFAAALRLAADLQEQKDHLETKIASDAPKVAFAETIRAMEGVCHVEKVAKTLGYGRNKFFRMMRADGILMNSNLPYQKYIDRDYFTVIEQDPYTDSKGVSHPTFTAMVTGAGQVFLAKKYATPEMETAL